MRHAARYSGATLTFRATRRVDARKDNQSERGDGQSAAGRRENASAAVPHDHLWPTGSAYGFAGGAHTKDPSANN